MPLNNMEIIGLYVYLEKRKTRLYVGELFFDDNIKQYCFTYDMHYLFSKNIIPMGPELPLTQQKYYSTALFPSFRDRIPSRSNPAYSDYCYAMGIDEKESNPIILLSTIGKRGPSSLVFEPHYKNNFDYVALKKYRKELGLTLREFANCFEIAQAGLIRIEQGQTPGNEILRRIEIYARFPEIALFQVRKMGVTLHSNKQKEIIDYLKELLRKEAKY